MLICGKTRGKNAKSNKATTTRDLETAQENKKFQNLVNVYGPQLPVPPFFPNI